MSPAVTRLSPRERLDGVLPDIEIAALAPVIEEIEELKESRNAVVLAHNYMTPDIYHGVADMKGDSLALARFPKRPMRKYLNGWCAFHGRNRKDRNQRKRCSSLIWTPVAHWLMQSLVLMSVCCVKDIRGSGRHVRKPLRRGKGRG
ncbi:MAG: hypothetical protein Ct9H300mP15_29650 [Gemmatimonadota bacterium]|nr:MAG: hypothetical protein Ct9H300mP15_29650 [Gemmatimonadota bacterium]